MTDSPAYPDSGDDTRIRLGRASTMGTPRWVKVFGIIALVLVLLFGILLLTGRGDHGPGRHIPSGDARGHASPAGGHAPPAALGGTR